MADTYPTLGLNIDLAQISASADALNSLRQSYKDTGQAAVDSATQANKAAQDQSSAYTKAVNQMASDAQRVTTFRMNLIRQEAAEVAQAAAAELAAINSLTAQRQAAYQAWTIGSQTANAKMLSDTLDRITDANAAEFLGAQARIDSQMQELAQRQAVQDAIASATAARVAAELESEELLDVYITQAQIKRMNDAAAAAAYETELAQEAAAAKIAAIASAQEAQELALAQDKASYESWWALMASQPAQAGVTTIAGTEADIAAREADAAAMAAQTAAGEAYIAQLQQQTATLGMTRSELAAYRAEQLGVSSEVAPFVAALQQFEEQATHSNSSLGALGGTALRVREPLVDIREILRGDYTRLAGSATLTAQAFGLLNGTTLPLLAFFAAFSAFLYEVGQGSAQITNFNNALAATANYAGLTTDGFNEMAAQIAATGDVSIGMAEKLVQTMTVSGKVTGDTMGLMGEDAAMLAEQTGQTADKVLQSFEQMAEQPGKLAAAYAGPLSAAQVETIEQLERMGQVVQADELVFQDLHDYLAGDGAAKLQGWGGLWMVIGQTISGVLDDIRHIGQETPTAQKIASLQAAIQAGGTYGTNEMGSTFLPYSSSELAGLHQQLDALTTQQRGDELVAQAAAASAQTQRQGVTAHDFLYQHASQFGGSGEAANEEIANVGAQIAAALAANPTDSLALAQQQQFQNGTIQAGIRKRYDRSQTQADAAARKAAGQQDSAQLGISKTQADVTSLSGQLGNMDPSVIADSEQKIQDAYTKALDAYSKTTNAYKEGEATQYAALAADKERLTIWNQMANADDKQTLSEQSKAQAIKINTDATTAANQILTDFYASGTENAAAYSLALQTQTQIMLAAQDQQADYSIAIQYGATSVAGIAQALIASLPPWVQVTDTIKQQAAEVQQHAQNTLNATKNVNALTQAEKDQKAAQDQVNAALADVSSTNAYVAALQKGIAAMADYQRQQAILKELPLAGNNLQAATFNVDAQSVANADKITADLQNQARLAAMSTDAQQQEARAQQIITGELAKQGVSYASLSADDQARVTNAAKIQAALEQQTAWLAKLTGSTEDAIEKAFVDTGSLNFSSLETAVEQELRKAIYNAFLAQPIDMAVNLVISSVEGAITGALGLAGGAASSAAGGLGISGLLSGGLGAIGLGGLLGGAGAGASSSAAIIAGAGETLGTGGAAAGGAGGLLGGAAGLLGPAALLAGIGYGISMLFGPKPSNYTATAQFTGQNYTLGGDKPDAATTSAMTSVAQSIQQTIQSLDALGVNADNVVSSIALGARDPSKVTLTNGQTISTPEGDSTALENAISTALLQNATYTDPAEQAMVQQMLSAGDTFAEISTAIQNWQTTQTQNTQAVTQLSAAMVQAQATLETYVQSLDTNTSLSPLSPADQLSAAQTQFDTIANQAAGGNATAMGQVQGAAETYLEQAHSYYASSSDYASIFNTVESMLDALTAYQFNYSSSTGNSTNGFSFDSSGNVAQPAPVATPAVTTPAADTTPITEGLTTINDTLEAQQAQAAAFAQMITNNPAAYAYLIAGGAI